MTLAQIIPILLQVSVALVVFSIGLQAAPGDLGYLFRRPALLARSVLAMNVVMPLITVGIAAGLKLRPEVETALLLLSVSPVPPILPNKQVKAGGNKSYAIGLLAFEGALAIVAVPLSVAAIARLFGHVVAVPGSLIARVVGISVLGPLLAGALARRLAPALAGRAATTLSMIGTILLLLVFLPVVAGSWHGLTGVTGRFTIAAVVVLVIVSLVVGHLLGGPAEDDRTVLALSTASRHPGVALAVAGAALANRQGVPAAVMLAFLVAVIATVPYTKWRHRAHATTG
jgi:BASS family bile acid:Na+ symporter